jgi:Mg2+/Co2+ transporter CorB
MEAAANTFLAVAEMETDRAMSATRLGMRLVGVVGLLAATLAAATIWLLFADPVTVADAVSEQDMTPVVRELAAIMLEALRRLLRYL